MLHQTIQTRHPPPIVKIFPERNWYAIYTRSRCEKKIHNALQKNHYQSFLPLIKVKRQWSDRIKTVETPLLPGYVFVSIAPAQISEIYHFTGMVNFVLKEGRPAIIKTEEISILEKIIRNEIDVRPVYECTIGQTVEITHGPFRGMIGKVTKKANGCKVLLLLDSINQSFHIELSDHDITNIK